jgi:hypothetical protein
MIISRLFISSACSSPWSTGVWIATSEDLKSPSLMPVDNRRSYPPVVVALPFHGEKQLNNLSAIPIKTYAITIIPILVHVFADASWLTPYYHGVRRLNKTERFRDALECGIRNSASLA